MVLGEARAGSAAQVRVKDVYGQQHYVMAEPDSDEVLKQGDAVSVMTRGLVWARVAAGKTAAEYEAVKFNAQGELDNTAADTLTNAAVRAIRTFDGKTLALVELHAPTA